MSEAPAISTGIRNCGESGWRRLRVNTSCITWSDFCCKAGHFADGLNHQLWFIEMDPMSAFGGDDVLAMERVACDGVALGQLRCAGIGCRNDGYWNVSRKLGALGRLRRARRQRLQVVRHREEAFGLAPMRLYDGPGF